MRIRATAPAILGWAWLVFAAGFSVIYRAFTQSFSIDEAYVFHLFLNQKAAVMFQVYDAAYHVLHTWLSWLSVHALGRSEIAVRLPSVIAGIAYLAGAGVLCRRILGDGWRFAGGVVLLSASPLLADYLSMARGYGAALAFYAWGFDALLGRKALRASLLFGLSVACNLTFAVPAAAAGLVFLLLEAGRGEAMLPLLRRLVLPAVAVGAPILAIPLWHARATHFYYGAEDLGASLNTLIAPSLAHGSPVRPAWVEKAERFVFPVVGALLAIGGVLAWKRRDVVVTLPAASLALSLLVLIAAHAALGVLYPWTRSGLYLIWLFQVACLSIWASPDFKWFSPFFGVVSLALAAMFLAQFETRYYYDFRDDAEVWEMMQRLRAEHSTGAACIGGSWPFEPTVNYYRLRYRMSWLQPMTRTDVPQPGCAYFVLLSTDERFVEQLRLRRLWSGPVSGAILAEGDSH